MKRPLFTLFSTSLLFFGAASARAEGANDKVSAEALFDEGRKLMAAGKFADACPKFEASQELDPGVGTMLNLADCYEKTGRTASAWAEFRETVSAAHNAGSRDREDIARGRANDLEPKLSYLTIVPWKGQGVVVTRDGARVENAALGAAIPVDPGRHVIVASAPGKREWSTTANVGADADHVSVAVPILPDDSSDGAHPGVTPPPAPVTDHGASSNPGSTNRTLAFVAGGVGVAGLVVGTVFTIGASSKWSDAKAQCTDYPNGCSQNALDLKDSADSKATIATVGFVVGAVGLATGAVLWFTAPKAESSTGVALGIGPGSIVANGRW